MSHVSYPRNLEVRPMAITPGFQDRPYGGEADLQPLADLFAAADAVDQVDEHADVEGLRRWFESPGVDRERDLRVWVDTTGRVVAFAWAGVSSPDDAPTVEGRLY